MSTLKNINEFQNIVNKYSKRQQKSAPVLDITPVAWKMKVLFSFIEEDGSEVWISCYDKVVVVAKNSFMHLFWDEEYVKWNDLDKKTRNCGSSNKISMVFCLGGLI